VRHEPPRFRFADPDGSPGLVELESSFDGRYDVVELPAFAPWAIVLVREADS
jgi:hypothetical protein